MMLEKMFKEYALFPYLPANVSPYAFPFMATGYDLIGIKKITNDMGLDCLQWPELPEEVELSKPWIIPLEQGARFELTQPSLRKVCSQLHHPRLTGD